MRRNSILTIIIILASLFCVNAQGSIQRVVGYTLTEAIDVKGAAFGKEGTYSVGALLPASLTEEYRGCRIIGMKVAAGCNLGRSRMFLYDVADDSFKTLHEQNQRLYEGWNEISFSGNGYTIGGTENLFFGFDYVETADMASSLKGGIAAVGEDTPMAFMLRDGDDLKSVSGVGMLCVQLLVDVSNMPESKLSYTFFDTGFRYKKPTEKFELMSMVRNSGRDDISSFRMAYRFDSREPVYQHVDTPLIPGASYTYSVATAMPSDLGVGAHTFTVWVDSINGKIPSDVEAGRRSVSFAIYQNECQRSNMYVEIYSDQDNPYSALFDEVVAKTATIQDVKTQYVKILSPSNSLGVSAASCFRDYYAYTVPSFTINRSYFPCENHIAYDMNDYLMTFPADMTTSILASIVGEDISSRCFTDMDMEASYDEATRRLRVNVKGTALGELEAIYGRFGITLMLVEDGVKAPQATVNAAGRMEIDNDYVHNNVLRAYMTDPLGDEITPASGAWSGSFETTLDPAWNIGKMRVVALGGKFGSDREGEKLKDYDVTNCAVLPLSGFGGIEQLEGAEAPEGEATYFTLDGRKVAEPLEPGIYVKRLPNGKSSKIMVTNRR